MNDTATGKKTHEDHFGIIDRVLWPVVHDGRLERLGYIFLGSWFLEQLRHEAGRLHRLGRPAGPPPIARKLYGLLENDRFEQGDDGEEWQAYWLGPPFFASVGSTCARERDNVAAVARACEAIAGHPGTGYRFSRERVAGRRRLGPAAGGLAPGRERRPPAQPAPAGPRRRRLSGPAGGGRGRPGPALGWGMRACMQPRRCEQDAGGAARAAACEDMARMSANMHA